MKQLTFTVGFSAISVCLALSLMGMGPGMEPGESTVGPVTEGQTVASETPGEILNYESPVFTGDGEAHRPKQELEKDGKQYRLVFSELQKAVKTGRSKFVSSQITFSLEGDWQPPDKAEILVTDEDTGQSLEYTVPRMEIVEVRTEWIDDFTFPVTVSDYGAEAFLLGDKEIPGDVPLSQYGPDLLNYLGLSEDFYQVEEVRWDGEPYERDGKYVRDALAIGKKLVRSVKVRYGGQVDLPPVEGLKYHSVYREITGREDGEMPEEAMEESPPSERHESTSSISYEASEDLTSDENLMEKFSRWLMEHLTIIRLSAGFLAGILFAVILLVISTRQENKKKPGGSA